MKKVLAVVAGLFVSAMAWADAVDFTQLTKSVDFSSVITAVMSVMGLLVGVYLAIKGGKIVLGLLRGA